LGIAEMLTNDEDFLDKLDDFNREMIMSIKEEMQRLLDYNDKLYHWSNLELGNFEIVHEKINLFELVTKAYQTSKAKMDAKSIVFENSVDKDTAIEVDITLILQVLNNLLSNAVKFTPNNGNISVSSQFTGDGINLVVADSGVGMPPEVRDTLFDDSIRSTTLGTLGEKGSGLGIGIIKKIIDAHGFSIKVESEKGKGTSFIISIPKENIS
jgi:signal transduction histidine kinase